MKRIAHILLVVGTAFLSAELGSAQETVALGTPAFGSFAGGPDTVNLANLNVHWQFPIVSKAGRGLPFTYYIPYDSTIWAPVVSGSTTAWAPQYALNPVGWPTFDPNVGQVGGSIQYTTVTRSDGGACNTNPADPHQQPVIWSGTQYGYSSYAYVDPGGTSHAFPTADASYVGNVSPSCPYGGGPINPNTTTNYTSVDGFTLTITENSAGVYPTVTNKKGQNVTPTSGTCGSTPYPGSYVDANGNEISQECGVFTDTLGVTALTVSGSNSSPPVDFSVPKPGGTAVSTLDYTSYTVLTNFGCSGISEYGPTVTNLPSKLVLADGRSYIFTYESTPGHTGDITGRIASVTLPSGGVISYAYSGGNNGITCADGSTSGLTRTTPDGATAYVRNTLTGGMQTTITYPSYAGAQNQTLITFAGNALTSYEVARQIFTGSTTSGTLLETILTCYQASASSCATTVNSAGSPALADNYTSGSNISNMFIWNQWPSSGGVTSGTQTTFDIAQNPSSTVIYDFAASTGKPSTTALQTTAYTYAFSTTGSGASFESSSPSEIKVTDSSGTMVSDTKYTYDGTSTMASSGTPQHTTPLSSPLNLTQTQQWVTGTTYLTLNTSYFDTGQVYQSSDVNGNTTTYSYGSGSCGNSFPTGVSTPTGGTVVTALSTSATWNCSGGVQLTSTDVNNNVTTYGYGSDPYWRPVSVTNNSTTAVTDYTYPTSTAPTTSTVALTFNSSSSTSNSVTTYDGLGRVALQQTLQSPTSSDYDTVAVTYDALGRIASQTLPYTGTAGDSVPSNPGVSTTYDAANRTTEVTDGGGGYTQYSYYKNDVLVTVGPQVTAPASENLKKRNLQYNGAGLLTSVCELVTSTSPAGGGCGQTAYYTGYLTSYTYDGAGRLTETQQNAQPGSTGVQTRNVYYDGLGRKTKEIIPEWSAGGSTAGTAYYLYDTSSGCSSTSTGDLVQSTDAMGNSTCITYDALHRPLRSWVGSSGGYSSVTPNTYAVYDAATYSGAAMSNAKGTVAEAYTSSGVCPSPCSSKLTDIYFSTNPITSGATAGGIVKNTWESMPHSSTYYHVEETYYPNGAVGSFAALLGTASIGIPNLTYGVDGEGRLYSATEPSHNLITATTYNSASSPLSLTFGNGDSDTFTYDPNTYRPTGLTATITPSTGNYTVASALTWNANSSLQQFTYTDGSPSPLSQTCLYKADDLSRISYVNCTNSGTTVLSQTFTYDPFGNIKKGGSPTYSASYQTATNQVSSGISPSPAYDANGNQKNLTATGESIAWNANNQPISMNGVTATYDALGRMVETGSGSSYEQFVFRPSGALMAIYNAGTSTLVKGTIPLPGGDTAIYNSSGLSYLRHTDWLGSSRLATTWAHAVYSKEAYAPFGETYNEAGTADRSFTGQDQDVVTGSGGTGAYDFLFRKHDPSAGRWLSPDPAGWGAVDLSNPQTLDRYAYVGNQPLNSLDPNGEWWCFAGITTEGGYDLTQGGFTCYEDGFGNALIGNPGGGMVAQNGVIYAPAFDSNGIQNGWAVAGGYWYETAANYTPPRVNLQYCTVNSCPMGPSGGSGTGSGVAAKPALNNLAVSSDCAAKARIAMNEGPSISPTLQNIIDGVGTAAMKTATTVYSGGTVGVLSVLTSFVQGASIRSGIHAVEDGLLYQTTFGTCMQAAGLSSTGFNSAAISF